MCQSQRGLRLVSCPEFLENEIGDKTRRHLQRMCRKWQDLVDSHGVDGSCPCHFARLFVTDAMVEMVVEATNSALKAAKLQLTNPGEFISWVQVSLMVRLVSYSTKLFFAFQHPQVMNLDRFQKILKHVRSFHVAQASDRSTWDDQGDGTSKLR